MSRTYREVNFIFSGLKSLHLVEYTQHTSLNSRDKIMKCLKCGRELKKKKIILHFSMSHKDIYGTMTTLAKRWGIISSTESDDMEEGEEDMTLITNS